MSRFQAALTHPVFSCLFAQANPLFWPVLYWQMGRHFRWVAETGYLDMMVRIEWWGGITVGFTGDTAPDPSAYRACTPARPRWDDPVWASEVADLPQTLVAWHALILPCAAGGGGSELSPTRLILDVDELKNKLASPRCVQPNALRAAYIGDSRCPPSTTIVEPVM